MYKVNTSLKSKTIRPNELPASLKNPRQLPLAKDPARPVMKISLDFSSRGIILISEIARK
jgi:hypothetical protein